MAKDLPYFKFIISEWNDGDIQLCSFEAQGVFINLCSLYWSKEGQLFLSKAKRFTKFLKVRDKVWQELIDENCIKVNNDKISISFLEEQLQERKETSKKNSENVSKRYQKTTIQSTPVESRSTDNEQPVYNIKDNKIIEEEMIIKEEDKKEENGASKLATIAERKLIFEQKVFSHQPEFEEKMLREFSDYWTETNEGGKKMRFEKEKVFELKRRIVTWRNRQFEFIKNGKQNGSINKKSEHTANLAKSVIEHYGLDQ